MDDKRIKALSDKERQIVEDRKKIVFSIANTLRGPYKSDKYKNVIIPMVILRRFECALDKTRDKVATFYEKWDSKRKEMSKEEAEQQILPDQILYKLSGFPFYNRSRWTLRKLLDDPNNIADNLQDYIDCFSTNIQVMFAKKSGLDFSTEIEKMDAHDRLFGVVTKFSELDLNPDTVRNDVMGTIFEEIINKFSENAEAGDHYTPREVIRLLVKILTAEGIDDIYEENKLVTVYDPACGSGGMLSATYDEIRSLNNTADVVLFGQEVNPESYAICLADMMIKGQKIEHIKLQDTMKKEASTGQYCFDGTKMRLVIMNPPFGTAWKGKDAAQGVEKSVLDEYAKGHNGRFSAGLPAGGDMQLLFMQVAIDKMDENTGRAAIITNGSPLFSGGTMSGESQIRKWMLDNDYIEAIIALPTDLFYNTGIGIYAFILSKNKQEKRKNKIQLINAVDFYEPLRKSLGKKRRELSAKNIKDIIKIYAEFKEGKYCKIFDRDEFLYREYTVYQPLQRAGKITPDSIEALKQSSWYVSNFIVDETVHEELDSKITKVKKAIEASTEKGNKLVKGKAEKELKKLENKKEKFIKDEKLGIDLIQVLSSNISNKEFNDLTKFKMHIKTIVKELGLTSARLDKLVYELSVMDKTAVIQKDKKGKTIYDPATKDSEIIRFNQDTEEYFKTEVYPHVPDAHYEWEGKSGAEFPFMRYFYEYNEPPKADDLLKQFFEIEKNISSNISQLSR